MPLFNGEEMRRKLEENLRRLRIQTQLQTQIPTTQGPINKQSDGQQQQQTQ